MVTQRRKLAPSPYTLAVPPTATWPSQGSRTILRLWIHWSSEIKTKVISLRGPKTRQREEWL